MKDKVRIGRGMQVQTMNGTQTLSRALDILFALSEANGTLSVSEIAEKVSIPESSIYRFLQTLEKNGIVERRGKSQIGLGLRILDLASSLNQQNHRSLLSVALPIMEELTEQTKETSLLFIRAGHSAFCVQHVKCRELIQFAIENGRTLPLNWGASGKSILAFENERFRNLFLQTLSDAEREALHADLENTRRQGYSMTISEYDPNVFAIGSPVLDSHGLVVASLSIAGPSFRCPEERRPALIEQIVDAAARLSRHFGGGSE